MCANQVFIHRYNVSLTFFTQIARQIAQIHDLGCSSHDPAILHKLSVIYFCFGKHHPPYPPDGTSDVMTVLCCSRVYNRTDLIGFKRRNRDGSHYEGKLQCTLLQIELIGESDFFFFFVHLLAALVNFR